MNKNWCHQIVKWQCPLCDTIVTSDSREHHKMDWCKCRSFGYDLEYYQERISFPSGKSWKDVKIITRERLDIPTYPYRI